MYVSGSSSIQEFDLGTGSGSLICSCSLEEILVEMYGENLDSGDAHGSVLQTVDPLQPCGQTS
jgi:hypothetical protein